MHNDQNPFGDSQEGASVQQSVKAKRPAATKLIVFYDDGTGSKGVEVFDYKSDLDNWQAVNHRAKILRVFRGVEKQIHIGRITLS